MMVPEDCLIMSDDTLANSRGFHMLFLSRILMLMISLITSVKIQCLCHTAYSMDIVLAYMKTTNIIGGVILQTLLYLSMMKKIWFCLIKVGCALNT